MKKFYSFALILITLFSGVLFSACANKYNNLKISYYSIEGNLMEGVRFVLDNSEEDLTQRIEVKFKNIDEDDVGQVLVYSVPNELVTVSNYSYVNKSCFVDVTPNMATEQDAKLIACHLASGKKQEIPLVIEQKSNNINVVNSKYVVSIPKHEDVEHIVDLSKTYDMVPSFSTDDIYFKLDSSVQVGANLSLVNFDGVNLIPFEGLDGVYKGFRVSTTAISSDVPINIYPVTYLEDYNHDSQLENVDQYENKQVSVYFKETLSEKTVKLTSSVDVDLNNVQLIANHEELNSLKFSLTYIGEILNEEDDVLMVESEQNFFSMYKIVLQSQDTAKVSAFTDAQNNIIVTAHTYCERPVELKVILEPINFVGDVVPVELLLKVKGENRSTDIRVTKNGEVVSPLEKINIFDYYESGTSYGALFKFNPGEDVHEDLNKMRILVDATILCEENVNGEAPEGVEVNSKLYSLMFNLVDDYLSFTYDESLGLMVSAEINADTRVYIKYVNGGGETEPVDFGMSVETLNKSTLAHWQGVESTKVDLNFNRLEGVKSMELQAGHYHVSGQIGLYNIYTGPTNFEHIYLNRIEGLDNESLEVYTNFLYVKDTVLGADDELIEKVDFEVKIEPLKAVTNPLKIYNGECNKDGEFYVEGSTEITHNYDKNVTNDVVGLVYRKNTSLGDYKITFYQENIVRASVICTVYENLTELTNENISLETNKNAFKNETYSQYASHYIVARGQELSLSLDLPQAVLNSNIVEGYTFDFKIGLSDGTTITEAEIEKTDFFNVVPEVENSNTVKLQFKKGTFIAEQIQYVYLTARALIKNYENIITENGLVDPAPSVEISFFIYEPIQKSDLMINHINLTRYPESLLAVDYRTLAEADLKISMSDELWNYTTGSDAILWSIDGIKIEYNYDSNADGVNDWYIENGVIVTSAINTDSCLFKFNVVPGLSEYTRTIKAYITQFEEVFELQCVVFVDTPIITQRVVIESEVKLTDDELETPYINLKEGDSYKVLAQNISNLGEVTHPEIVIQVASEFGNANNVKNYIDVNQTDSTLTVKNVDGISKFKLIVFAKDALKEPVSSDKSGYNIPSNFLMDGYKNAYFVVDVYLSDGTETNPYFIEDAYDFWGINDNELFKGAHYQLMTNISLDDVNNSSIIKTIENFTGTIRTYNNNSYSIDGVLLNEDMLNLFTNFNGKISNVKFDVKYNYALNSSETQWLGVIDKNLGILENVSVSVKGLALLDGTATYYFGGLVGENNGEIVYTSGVGVSGLLDAVSGNAKVYLGGLIGNNISSIVGCEFNNSMGGENTIQINTNLGRQNVLSQISIVANLSNGSAIGGVVGLNSYGLKIGTIKNAYVEAKIVAENTNNVGGVIGENKQVASILHVGMSNGLVTISDATYSSLLEDAYVNNAIHNVKSSSTIKAKNFAGGIVGLDTNGVYVDCDYQILSQDLKTPAIVATSGVGGIAGNSNSGKFIFCSVMSYNWNYEQFKATDKSQIFIDVADLQAVDYVGGIVGYAQSSTQTPFQGGDIVDKVIMISSSVNAYLEASNEETGNVGGILSAYSGDAVIFNTYFMGKLTGNVVYDEVDLGGNTHYFALDNNKSSFYNATYSLNIETNALTTTLKRGNLIDGENFSIDVSTDVKNYWWFNQNINGGYIFVTIDTTENENKLPIYDLAPESIDVTVKDPAKEGLDRVLLLDYYDFSVDENATDNILLNLIEKTNRQQKLVDLLNIVAYPENIGTVVINVKSTNSSVVDISYDGRLIINSVGECELVFSSVLNPNAGEIANRTIKVYVDYPMGDEFDISTSRTDKSGYLNGRTLNIGQNNSKQLYAVTSGEYVYRSQAYNYRTKTNLNLEVNISHDDSVIDVEEYLILTGVKQAHSNVIYDIDEKTPFMISVKKMLENAFFDVMVTPYVIINGVKVSRVNDGEIVEFKLSTLKGLTNVAFSYDDAIVYPNDTVYIDCYLSTDHKLENTEILELVKLYYNEDIYNNASIYINNNNNFDAVKQVQTVKLRIEFSDVTLTNELPLELRFGLGSGIYESVYYTILPQRINKIEIKNYYYRNTYGSGLELVQQDILKPNAAGEMIVDIVPDNGYYDYLEISDITGNEEIKFIQVDENGNALSVQFDPSSDNKGIKLYDYGFAKNRIYIRTQIDNKYSSKIHTVEVRAYSSNGTLLASNRKYIDVKMLPEIITTYLLPDGTDGIVAGNGQGYVANQTEVYLANGVDANLRIETINANTDVEYTITSTDSTFASNYELIHISNNLYTLKSKSYNEDNIGKNLKLSFVVYSLLDNGDFDVAQCSIEFVITNFVIHGVSVNNSIDNSSTKEIYGYFDREIDLEFYFDETDISYYNANIDNFFWNKVYDKDDEYDTSNADLNQIYDILKELNNTSSTKTYLILNENKKTGCVYESITSDKITLNNNKLTVKEDYNETSNKYLAVAFMLKYDKSNVEWNINEYNSTITADDIYYIVDKNYKLDFRKVNKMFEPTVINSEEEFLEMSSGGAYILNTDLEFGVDKAFKPIDANLVEFDGNGHTITIKCFDLFNDVSLRAGLFAQIYPNMVVKNVKVEYVSSNNSGNYTLGKVQEGQNVAYYDLTNNPNILYTDVKFGGLTAVNNGIITNCVVEGQVALRASILENKSLSGSGNYEIDFNIAGMVAENSSTGYITNSQSQLNIFALANIGGFVHTNQGKIVSCGVEEDTTIYGYNVNLGNTIIVDIAGFAVENLGEISMSYVNLVKSKVLAKVNKDLNDDLDINQGTMSAKDFSAGFVSLNSGKIYDAYVQMTHIGNNNNRFAGFVDTNLGSIIRAYTYINSGIKASKDDAMFVGENAGILENCVQIVTSTASENIEGLISLNVSERYNKTNYQNNSFAFGENVSAVWTISAGNLPKLVSTQEMKFEDFDKLTISQKPTIYDENGNEIVEYEVNYANYGTKRNPFIIYDLATWNYYFNPENNINMTGYYRIVNDIDFSLVGDNPLTSEVVFLGNIQGNNMTLKGIMLYSSEQNNNSSLGLFKEMVGTNDKNIVNAVRNLTLKATSVWASSTNSVGVLAGVIEDFNVYNINIDAPNVVIVGKNAVGGVAGVIRGNFDIDQVSSNIGANSTRASTLTNYSIYMSKNNGVNTSDNLQNVYYAGSVAGILDGYGKVIYSLSNERNINRNYFNVRNINVNGKIVLSGDTVGSAFGLVGELVRVDRVNIDVAGRLIGSQYSAGVAGENRGVITNAKVSIEDETFKRSQYVSAGVVGLNLGGLVKDVEVRANIIKTDYSQTTGGIIGRNVNGVVANAYFDGELISYFTGGIVGANYNYRILADATTGTGAIHGECKVNSKLIPTGQIEYFEDVVEITNFTNVSLSLNAFELMIENSSSFYSYKNDNNSTSLSAITIKSKVLGLVVGLSCVENIVGKTSDVYNINYNATNEIITFNAENRGVQFMESVNDVMLKDVAGEQDDVVFNFENVNVLDITGNKPYVMYLVGAVVPSFDSWSVYSGEYLLVK